MRDSAATVLSKGRLVMKDWLKMSAAALGRGIGAKEIDPVDLAQTYLEAAAAHPMCERIYTCLTPERALSEAKAASARAKLGQRLSPLDGVPVSWKDLFDSAGNTATMTLFAKLIKHIGQRFIIDFLKPFGN